jgi:hypothetical protein
MRSFCFTIVFCNFATLGKVACLSMPKFLADHRYNQKETNRCLKKEEGYWPVQINGNKFATDQILEKPGRSYEGANF